MYFVLTKEVTNNKFCYNKKFCDLFLSPCLKNKIENYSTWEGAFYQSEWDKINSNWVLLVFQFLCNATNASELFCMVHVANAFYTILTFDFKCQILYASKLPSLSVKNQLKREKVRN